MSFLKLLGRKILPAPPSPQQHNNSTPLQDDDILLCIASQLDAGSILSLRLVNRTIGNTLKNNESWICKAVASRAYGWVFECIGDSAFRDKTKPAIQHQINSFKMLIRLHLATQLPILLLWNRYKDNFDVNTTFIVPGTRITATCARGFLTLWALADIEREVERTPTAWLPRGEYFVFSRLSEPFVRPGSSRGLEESVACGRRATMSRWAERFQSRVWSLGELDAGSFGLRRPPRSSEILPGHQLERYGRSRRQRLELIATLDQGAWLDLHIVTTLVLAFYISYADITPRLKSQSMTDKLALAEWGLRQGPDPILGLLSIEPKFKRYAAKWIDREWRWRHKDLKALDGAWNVGPLGISTSTTGRYPHPKCEEWEREGWPTLVECTKMLLFRDWRTYHLQSDSSAEALANALAQRTSHVTFQAGM